MEGGDIDGEIGGAGKRTCNGDKNQYSRMTGGIRRLRKIIKKKCAKAIVADRKIWQWLLLFLCLTVTACGDRTDTVGESETAVTTIDENAETEKQSQTIEDAAGMCLSEEVTETNADQAEQKITEVITVYTTDGILYSDEEIPVQYTDDLSLLDHMGHTDGSYAYRDKKVYYRQYHGDSFEEGALWAYYQPTAGTDKEIVCIDPDGEKTVLFPTRDMAISIWSESGFI